MRSEGRRAGGEREGKKPLDFAKSQHPPPESIIIPILAARGQGLGAFFGYQCFVGLGPCPLAARIGARIMINSGGGRVSWRSAIRRALEAAALHDPQKKGRKRPRGEGKKRLFSLRQGAFSLFPPLSLLPPFFWGSVARPRAFFPPAPLLPSCPHCEWVFLGLSGVVGLHHPRALGATRPQAYGLLRLPRQPHALFGRWVVFVQLKSLLFGGVPPSPPRL